MPRVELIECYCDYCTQRIFYYLTEGDLGKVRNFVHLHQENHNVKDCVRVFKAKERINYMTGEPYNERKKPTKGQDNPYYIKSETKKDNSSAWYSRGETG